MSFVMSIFQSELWQSLTWVDAVVLGVLLLSMGLGFATGFVWQVLRIVAVVAAFWVAASFHELAAGQFASVPSQATLALSYTCLFFGALVVAYILMTLVRERVNAMKPELTDRILGSFFGLIKGFLLCGIIGLALLNYGGRDSVVTTAVAGSGGARFAVQCVGSLWRAVSTAERAQLLSNMP